MQQGAKGDLVRFFTVPHDIPFAGKQKGVPLGFQQREDLFLPLGAFLQELRNRPCFLWELIEQDIKHQEFLGTFFFFTKQGSDFPSAQGLDQTDNLVTVTKQHWIIHLDKKTDFIDTLSLIYIQQQKKLIGVYTMSL